MKPPVWSIVLRATPLALLCLWCGAGVARGDSRVIVWGSNNSSGQTNVNVPAALTNVVSIACGDAHTLALKADGTIIAWGNNAYGQTNIPTGLSSVSSVSAGAGYSAALKSNGTVIVWGITHMARRTFQPMLQVRPQSQRVAVTCSRCVLMAL